MAHTDTAIDQPSKEQSNGPRGRKKRSSQWRRLAKIVYRDPEHVAERLTLFGSKRLSGPSLEWANKVRKERPDAPLLAVAEEVRIQTAQVTRIDGAVAGTPFLVALVPGYLAYLWQEGRMEQRIAALYGHDPRELETSAEILVLRGVHPTVEAAREALLKVGDAADLPEKPAKRRPLRVWVRSIYVLLVFGGFLSGGSGEERDKYAHWRLKAALGMIAASVIWVITWVLPLTFMIAMAWACESHARSLGRRTMHLYAGESTDIEAAIAAAAEEEDQGRTKRDLLRGLLLVVSVAIPLAFVVYANYIRQTTGITLEAALGAVVAAALVIAVSVAASRR
jgi:hypothetical protein